mgnify:CR=1 FL=1
MWCTVDPARTRTSSAVRVPRRSSSAASTSVALAAWWPWAHAASAATARGAVRRRNIRSLTLEEIGAWCAERGFPADIYHRSLVVCALLSLVGNFLGGWLASRWSMHRLMALTMVLLAGALAGLPSLRTVAQVDAFA